MHIDTRTGATALLALVLSLPALPAQELAVEAPRIEIKSKALGNRSVRVLTPAGYATSNARYPVVVMLDANDSPMLNLASAAAAYIASNESGVPPVIIVGIVNGDDRINDMTAPATGTSIGLFPRTGGADAFADFIVDEALPLIRNRYRTLPTTVLIGHSAGGLFGLHVAANRPGKFQGIIVTSPALWYNDSTPARIYADGIARSGAPLRLFAAAGAHEEAIDLTTRRFAARLDSIRPAQVSFAHRRYTDDTHSMTPTYGIAEGLRFVFDPLLTRRLPVGLLRAGADSAAVVRALLASEAQYANAARPLLMPEALPALVANRTGVFALRTVKNPELAKWIFTRTLSHHPESAGARDGLADVYIAKGDSASALIEMRKVDEIVRSYGATLPPSLQRKLGQLEARAAKP